MFEVWEESRVSVENPCKHCIRAAQDIVNFVIAILKLQRTWSVYCWPMYFTSSEVVVFLLLLQYLVSRTKSHSS